MGNVIMEANSAQRSGNLVFEIKDLNISFGEKSVIKDFSATVMRGDRIGITGPNAAGKTTLIKTLLGQIKPTSGKVRTGVNVEIQYFDQYHEGLDLEKSVADNVADGHTEVCINGKNKHVISYLANFLFSGRRARSPVKVLSGGEKNRLLLARLFAKSSNVLIMDEPTNDLDLETLDLLEDLVSTYNGTVIIISHDRAFIDKVATETWVFDGKGHIESVIGGWSDVLAYYERISKNEDCQTKDNFQKDIKNSEQPSRSGTEKTDNSKKKKGLTFTQKHELKELPDKVEKLEADIALLDEQLTDPDLFADGPEKSIEVTNKRNKAQEELDKLYARWEELELINGE